MMLDCDLKFRRLYNVFRQIITAGLVCAASPFLASFAYADGEFFQFDFSETTSTGTVSIARGPLTYGANAVAYAGGRTYGLSATYQLPVASQFATLRLGPSIGYVEEDGTDETFEAGLKFVAERYIPTDFGSIFLLADLNSIDTSWFVLAQLGLAHPGIVVEVSRGESNTYSETSIAVTKKLGDSPANLRVGYRLDAEELFLGFSFNTF